MFVVAEEHASYQQYLRDNLGLIMEDESQSVTQRFASLNEVVRDVLATAFREGEPDETVATCCDLAENTVDLICREDAMESDLLGIMHHDYLLRLTLSEAWVSH